MRLLLQKFTQKFTKIYFIYYDKFAYSTTTTKHPKDGLCYSLVAGTKSLNGMFFSFLTILNTYLYKFNH